MTSPEIEPRMEAERLSFIEPVCNFLLDVKRLVKTSCLSFNLRGRQTRNKGRVVTPPRCVCVCYPHAASDTFNVQCFCLRVAFRQGWTR